MKLNLALSFKTGNESAASPSPSLNLALLYFCLLGSAMLCTALHVLVMKTISKNAAKCTDQAEIVEIL